MIRTRDLLAVLLAAIAAGATLLAWSDPPIRDSLAVSADVSAADHEVEDGYFTLGDDLAIVAKPGSDLHRWLSAHRGQRIVLTVRERRGVQ